MHNSRIPVAYKLMVCAIVFATALVCVWNALHQARVADRFMRKELLNQAVAIAQNIDPSSITQLSFTADDTERPAYKRLCSQFAAYRSALKFRGIWSMALRGDTVVFGPESYAPGDPFASPPGTPYVEATQYDFEIFSNGLAYAQGPFKDEYGEFVSASAPVIDPKSSQVVMAVGIDIMASEWKRIIRNERIFACLSVIPLGLLLIAGTWLHAKRLSCADKRNKLLMYAETYIVAFCSLWLTVLLADHLNKQQRMSQREMFTQLTANQACRITNKFQQLEKYVLYHLASLHSQPHQLTQAEFSRLGASYLKNDNFYGLAWVDRIAEGSRDEWENSIRADGVPDVFIWEPDPDGQRMPARSGRGTHYPVRHFMSHQTAAFAIGLDLGFAPAYRDALDRAHKTRLPLATPPVDFITDNSAEKGFAVFYPAFADRNDPAAFLGFATATVLPAQLIKSMAGPVPNSDLPYLASLRQLGKDYHEPFGAPLSPGQPLLPDAFAFHPSGQRARAQLYPLFAFGRAYVLSLTPGNSFLSASKNGTVMGSVMAGLTITVLLTLLTWMLLRKNIILEDNVQQRTGELLDSENRFRSLVESAPYAIIVQTNGIFSYANRRAITLLKAETNETLIGTKVMDRFGSNERASIHELLALSDYSETLLPTIEVSLLCMDGSHTWAEISAVPISFAGQNGSLIFAHDITSRKIAEKQQRKLEEQLLHSQKLDSLGQLAGGIAHDFNNMLQIIIGETEMLLADVGADSPHTEPLKEIFKSGKRSSELTRQLLAFASKQTIKPAVFDLNQKIEDQLRMLGRLIGEHIDIVWQPYETPLTVRMDPSQLIQILTNLTINARDAIGESGKMTIETSLASITESVMFNKNDLQPGQYAVLSVTDNGCGIPPENLTRIFEPFFTTKPVGKSSGLGLSTVYGIIRQCAGHISVYSEKGRGTTFRMYFSLCSEIATDQEHAPAQEPGTRCHETVLLVEDERALLAFVKKLLEQMGYNVLAAHGPLEAGKLEQEYTGNIHLLLTDVIMPEMNGPQLAAQLREKRPAMKVIFMSGYTANAITHQKILAKDTAFLSKPFSSSDLWFALRKVLDASAANPAGQDSGGNPVS